MKRPLAILSTGMVTGVGLNAPASCAAIRAGITGFEDTRFMDQGGKWVLGSSVPFDDSPRGVAKLARMASLAIREALSVIPNPDTENIPLFLGTAESGRAGRLSNLDTVLLTQVGQLMGCTFNRESRVIPQGRMAGITAIQLAQSAVFDAGFDHCLIVGVDSYLVGATLESFESRHRLVTSKNTDGFIPGEAAAALLVGRDTGNSSLNIIGIGSGSERATIESGEPLRADGLVAALNSVLADAGSKWDDLDYRVTDLNGEQYFFRETALALTRTLRPPKQEFDLWHTADCIGEIGAAAVPCAITVALHATTKDYAPGQGVLCHFSCDGPERAAVVLRATGPKL